MAINNAGGSSVGNPPELTEGRPKTNGMLASKPTTILDNANPHPFPPDDGKAQSQLASGKTQLAITGMAMRLPGGIRTAEGFWDFLMEGKDGHSPVPESRYSMSAHHSKTRPQSVRIEGGYFLQDDPSRFDAGFFNVPPRLAASLDPQQRLLLEVAWECIENAGESQLRGGNVGCFVGAFGNDWLELSMQDRLDLERNLTGCAQDFCLANQISRMFDLMGPSVTYRTACSSSMTALHHACQALEAGECDTAIVAGINLILSPTTSTSMSTSQALSPSGLCRTFDADADGYGRGEAVNAILIKRLDDALQNSDPIRAVIRATAINSDGMSAAIGVPRALGQEKVIRKAYEKAAIDDFSQTAFFECHGTGTQKGDVAETSVVAKVFEKGILMGSVKPNFGHSEGASGLTSVIKAILALEHRIIPPNVHLNHPNPRIPFEEARLRVPRQPTPWPDGCAERVSINCFGVGGANAHLILDSVSSFCATETHIHGSKSSEGKKLLIISANSEQSLERRQSQILEYLRRRPYALQDISYTLGLRREHLRFRKFFVADGTSASQGRQVQLSSHGAPWEVTFVFSGGQGAQWPEMGNQLLTQIKGFRNDIKQMDNILQSLDRPPGWTIEEALSNSRPAWIDEAESAQLLCTAVQIGLVNLLSHWGVRPSSVAGHSSGEIAAAYAAGAISLHTAIILSYYRGLAAKLHSEPGGMAVLDLGKAEVLPYLTNGVTVACENSPFSVTLSGAPDRLEESMRLVLADHPHCLCKRLPVKVAYNSEAMSNSAREYAKMIYSHLRPNESMIPMFSSVTGEEISWPDDLNTKYWRQTMESPVIFNQSITGLIKGSPQNRIFIEVGPQALLSGPMKQIFESCGRTSQLAYLPTLSKSKDPLESLLCTAGELYFHHSPLDLVAINGRGNVLTDLPLYPWDHDKQYWYETRITREWKHARFPNHPLLGSLSPESSTIEPCWRNRLQVKHVLWLRDHKVENEIVYPCVGYISMIGEAIRQVTGSTCCSIRELFMKTPMSLKENNVTEVITSLRPQRITNSADSAWYDFTVSAYDGSKWQKHCSGQVKGGRDAQWNYDYDIQDSVRNIRSVDPDVWYDVMKKLGLDLGPNFCRLEDITADPMNYQATATVGTNRHSDPGGEYGINPVMIDQGLQLLGVASCNGLSRRLPSMGIPISIDRIYVSESSEPICLQARFSKGDTGALKSALGGSVTGHSNGRLAFALGGVKLFPVNKPISTGAKVPLGSRLEWKPDIDLLDAKDFLFKSMPQAPYMDLVVKLMIVVIMKFVDRMGMGPSSFISSQSQAWTEANLKRIQEILGSFFPKAVDWLSDPIALQSKLIAEFTAATESSEPWVQPIQSYLTKVLDVLDDQVPFPELFIDHSGLKSLYEFAATTVDLGYAFSLLGHQNSSMAILEINSGTCGTTSGTLAALRSEEGTRLFSKYTFATHSSDLLAEASEIFADIDGFSPVSLDSNSRISAQGFEPKSYDLVIIPSNLPSIISSKRLLRDIRSLLIPGGRVLVREVTPDVPFIDYLMSLIPAPFSSFTSDLHLTSPYSADFWENQLLEAGFMKPELHTCAMFVYPWSMKQAILAKVPQQEPRKKDIYLLCQTPHHSWVDILTRHFSQQGYKVHSTTLEDMPEQEGDVIALLDLEVPFLREISAEKYNTLLKYVSQRRRTLWVSKTSQMKCDDPSSGLITGFARTIRLEASIEFATFEVDDCTDSAAKAVVNVYQKFHRQSQKKQRDPEVEFALHNGIVHVGRFHWLPLEQLAPSPKPDSPMTLSIANPGGLDSITWKQQQIHTLGEDDVEVDVHYVGMNFRDIMVTSGALDEERGLGLEASGFICRVGGNVKHVKPGDAVSVLGTGLYTSRFVTSSKMCFPISNGISLEDAATLPVAYGTAIYSLLTVGQLERGQSVLIHSACGAVGQAAIHIAQMMKANIYATVGSDLKVQYLEDTFGIPRANIFYSRDTSFVAAVMAATENQGIDLVLNSLAGELLHASWSCVAKFGKMVEIGKRDFIGHGMMKMEPFGANRTFIGVDLLQLALESPVRFARLGEMFTRLSLSGKIKPIQPMRIFDASETRKAFSYMQRGSHIGKILIRFAGANAVANIPKGITATSAMSFSPDAAYLLIGGLGGIGRAVSNWLVENGARHLVFLSRSGAHLPREQDFLEELRSQGCQPVAIMGSVANMDDVERAVATSPKPIAGVIHLGMVLKPAPLLETNYDDWKAVQDPKVKGAWNLHRALSSANLDFFVVLSSITGVCGSIGQVGYSSANAYLDALVRYRRSLGLPAATLNLGAVGDIGCFTREPEWLATLRQWELRLLDEREVIEALQATIHISRTPCGSHGVSASGQVIVGMSTTRTHADPVLRIPWHDARYRLYAKIGPTMRNAKEHRIVDQLKRYIIQAQQSPVMLKEQQAYDLLLEYIGHYMSFNIRNQTEVAQIAQMSIDSIFLIEAVGHFRSAFEIEMSMTSLSGATTVEDLSRVFLAELYQRAIGPKERDSL